MFEDIVDEKCQEIEEYVDAEQGRAAHVGQLSAQLFGEVHSQFDLQGPALKRAIYGAVADALESTYRAATLTVLTAYLAGELELELGWVLPSIILGQEDYAEPTMYEQVATKKGVAAVNAWLEAGGYDTIENRLGDDHEDK